MLQVRKFQQLLGTLEISSVLGRHDAYISSEEISSVQAQLAAYISSEETSLVSGAACCTNSK